MQLANESDRNRTPLLISQKIVQALYKTVTQLGREVFVALLDTLFATYPDVQHEALTWLIYADDEVSMSHTYRYLRLI
jgi:CCR4-NOT transcription complex subunit 1